jgi:ABC-type Mn2+/Zn2+ transport system permease subunit
MQVGGALGVGVLGTVLNLRYQSLMAHAVTHAHVPVAVAQIIKGSLGAALAVAHRAPKKLGIELSSLARRAFVSGMDEALVIAAVVVFAAALVALTLLPNRGTEPSE